jgi:SSS family solute:Na+ symporter
MLNRHEYPSLRQGLVGAWCPSLGASGLSLIDRSGRNARGTLTNMGGQDNWQASGTGVIAVIALYEAGYVAGFTSMWWGMLALPVGVILALTGFVYYRFRETRALTLAQFFETRYSPNFRKFAGIVCFLTGLINFGVFPAVAARVYVNFLGLPETFPIPGTSIEFSTFATLMALDLGIALLMVVFGGQISITCTTVLANEFTTHTANVV